MIRGINFLTNRFSRLRSATSSFSANASARRPFTSPVDRRESDPPDRFLFLLTPGVRYRQPAASCGSSWPRTGSGARLTKKFLGSAVVQALRNAPLVAKLGYAILATKPGKHDPDLLLRTMQLAGRTPDVLHNLLGRGLHGHGGILSSEDAT